MCPEAVQRLRRINPCGQRVDAPRGAAISRFGFRGAARYAVGGVKPLNKAVRQDLTENDQRLRRALIAFFARRVQTLPEAEDLTQDVFFRIVRDPKREAPMADAYVFRIAANLLRDKGRRERVRTSYRESRAIEDFLGIDPLDPHRVAEGRENLGLVARTIDQ
ncbi:MAG: hypothetical protein IH998_11275, partial [Proteobacteria bacterium]|nr:hypothetical protein [Pseudomonadota bacterium]